MAGAISQCGKCDLIFTSVESFNAHMPGFFQHGTHHYLAVQEMLACGMAPDHQGRWRPLMRGAAQEALADP